MLDSCNTPHAVSSTAPDSAPSGSNTRPYPLRIQQYPDDDALELPTLSSPSSPTRRLVDLLVPDEDPTRPIELIEPDTHDDYISLIEDGIGEEDGVDEEEYDEDDDAAKDDNSPPRAAPEQRRQSRTRPLPAWLMEAFKARLEESRERGPDKLPALYRTGTFWFPQKTSYFLLRDAPASGPTPQRQYNPLMFLWDPLALHAIGCPKCKTCLNRNGPIPYPRRVVSLDRLYWIIGYRYRCPTCTNERTGKCGTVTFRSWDSRVLDMLPAELRAEFPAHLSSRSGISKDVFHLM